VLLFVYGSLKSGYENAHLLQGATALGAVQTAAGYRLIRYRDGYPALVPQPGAAAAVRGELYAVTHALLAELDAFEECPTLYQRAPITLRDGRAADAYVVPSGAAAEWPTLDRY